MLYTLCVHCAIFLYVGFKQVVILLELETMKRSTPPPPLYKLRPCPSYSGCGDRINLVP